MEQFIEFDGFRIDRTGRQLFRMPGADPVAMPPRLFDALLLLVEQAGKLVTRSSLVDAIWSGAVVEDNAVSQAISRLRALLGDDGRAHRYIVTAPRKGYRFVAPLRAIAAGDAPATRDPAALDLMLRAEELAARPNEANLQSAILLLKHAIGRVWIHIGSATGGRLRRGYGSRGIFWVYCCMLRGWCRARPG